MIRMQVRLTEEQASALRRIAARDGVSMPEVIRRAIDRMAAQEPAPDWEDIKQRARAAAGSVRLGAPDVAERHDEYLPEAYDE